MIVAVIDTETTDLPRAKAAVIEVGAVLLELGIDADLKVWARRMEGQFDSLVQCPEESWQCRSVRAMTVNRITERMWQAAPTTVKVANELKQWLFAHKVDVITSFHTDFDFARCFLGSREWLGPMLWRSRLHVGPCLKGTWNASYGSHGYDGLAAACRVIGYSLHDHHIALHDALGAAELLVRDTEFRQLWWQYQTNQTTGMRSDYTLPRHLITRADVAKVATAPQSKEPAHE